MSDWKKDEGRSRRRERPGPGRGAYRLVVRLVVVVARRQVPHGRDREAAARRGVRARRVAVVTEALEQAADDFLVVADEIGILTDVVTVPDG